MKLAMLSIHSSPAGALGRRDTGGMSVVVRDLAAALARCGHRIDIFTCRGEGADCGPRQLAAGVRLIRLPLADDITRDDLYDHVAAIAAALAAYISRENLCYDVVHSHYWLSGLVGEQLRRSHRFPHAITFHTLAAVKNCLACGEDESPRRVAAERALAAACDRVLVAAASERDNVLRHCEVASEKLRQLPYGVDLAVFPLLPRRSARESRSGEVAAEVLLYVGRFTPVKGLGRLLQALPEVLRRRPRLVLEVIGGDGPDDGASRAHRTLAADLGVAGQVRWRGRIPHRQLPQHYAAADAVVVPSLYESYGLVVLEALASGTPVVATRVGVAAELIRDRVNGVLVSDPEPARLAAGICSLLERPPLAPRQLRASVAAHTWDAAARRGEDFYRELLEMPEAVAPSARRER